MPASHQQSVQAIPLAVRNAIAIPFVLLGVSLGVWSWWSEMLLYGWLKRAELALMHGSFYAFGTCVVTIVATLLVCFLPAMLILKIIIMLKVFPVPDPPQETANRSGSQREKSDGRDHRTASHRKGNPS